MDRIISVVVLYQPGPDVIGHLTCIDAQSWMTVVVDNGSDSDFTQILEAARLGWNSVVVLRPGRNVGVAAALNQGVRFALLYGPTWVATFDQDSKIGPRYFEQLLAVYGALGNRGNVGLLAPVILDRSDTLIIGAVTARDILFPITSGALLRADMVRTVGEYDEQLFIDQVDHDFSIRCHRAGYRLVQACEVGLQHTIGRKTRHRFLWWEPMVTNHSALRRYYMARNRWYIYRKHAAGDREWLWLELRGLVKEVLGVLLFEEQKGAKLVATAQGLFDAWRGRYGEKA